MTILRDDGQNVRVAEMTCGTCARKTSYYCDVTTWAAGDGDECSVPPEFGGASCTRGTRPRAGRHAASEEKRKKGRSMEDNGGTISMFAVFEPQLIEAGDKVYRVVLDTVDELECTGVFDIGREGGGIGKGYWLTSDTCWNRSFDDNYFTDRAEAEKMAAAWSGEKIAGEWAMEHAVRFAHFVKNGGLCAWIAEIDNGMIAYKDCYTYQFMEREPKERGVPITLDMFARSHTRSFVTDPQGGRVVTDLVERGDVAVCGEFPDIDDFYL